MRRFTGVDSRFLFVSGSQLIGMPYRDEDNEDVCAGHGTGVVVGWLSSSSHPGGDEDDMVSPGPPNTAN